jgi:hypothetical protein
VHQPASGLAALAVTLGGELRQGLLERLGIGLVNALVVGMVSTVVTGLVSGLSAELTEERVIPNEGIRRSARRGRAIGLIVWLVVVVVSGLSFGRPTGCASYCAARRVAGPFSA